MSSSPNAFTSVNFAGMPEHLIYQFAVIQMNAWKQFSELLNKTNVTEPQEPQVMENQVTENTNSGGNKPKKDKKEKVENIKDNVSDASSSSSERKKRGPSEYNKFISRELENAKNEPDFNHKLAFAAAVKKWKERTIENTATENGFGNASQSESFVN